MKKLNAALVALLFVGCAQEAAPPLGEEAGGEVNDDLVDRTVTIRTDGSVQYVGEGETVAVRPELVENWDGSIEIVTADLRPDPELDRIVMSVSNEPGSTDQFGLRIEFRDGDDDPWHSVWPDPSDESWLWANAMVEYDQVDGRWVTRLDGEAVQYVDDLGGLTYEQQKRRLVTVADSDGRQQVRILAIPAWTYWDWDDGEYVAEVDFGVKGCRRGGDDIPSELVPEGTEVGPYICVNSRWERL